MHSDPAEVRKSVRAYITVFVALMAFTIITVVAARFHFAVPIAITIALIIATMKGSMSTESSWKPSAPSTSAGKLARATGTRCCTT